MNNSTGLYIRLSQMDDYMKKRFESESVESQRMILRDYAEEHNFNVVKEYVDDGYSGTNFDRPAFKEMMEDLNNNVINTIMVKDLSRFGRDHIQTGYFIETYFPQKQIRFISLMENLDSATQSDYSDNITFVMACNDYLSKQNSLRIRAILDMKKREGKYVASALPYGYIRDPEDNGHLIPDPNTAFIVKEIFDLAYKGESTKKIANYLNEKGYITPSKYKNRNYKCNDKWSMQSVIHIITNPIYTGDMVQSKSTKISYKSNKTVNNPKSKWIVVKNTHEPLVSKSVFNRLGNSSKRTNKTSSGREKELLENLIYCKECGGAITLYKECRTKRIKGDCSSSKTRKTCSGHFFDYETFEEKVLNAINEINPVDKDKSTRQKVQKIIDAIFIDKDKNITVILKNKKFKSITLSI